MIKTNLHLSLLKFGEVKLTRLLIIGAGREQVYAYQTAKKMGLEVTGTDIDSEAPGFKVADDKLICSTRDPQQTLQSVIDYTKTKQIDGVMTIANDVSLTVAIIAKHFGAASATPPTCGCVPLSVCRSCCCEAG